MDYDEASEPFLLDIVSVTYGTKDYTAFVRDAYETDRAENPNIRSWSFQAHINFFEEDPNPGVAKVSTAVYRASGFDQGTGDLTWSDFRIINTSEGSYTTFDFAETSHATGTLPSSPPTPRSQYLITAWWQWRDVTTGAKNAFNAGAAAGQNFNLTIDSTTLGFDDPRPGNPSIVSLTFATWTYPGRWSYNTQSALLNPSQTLAIPPAFPPIATPGQSIEASFLRFQNATSLLYIYPSIFGQEGELLWDGQADNMLIPPGGSQDVLLAYQEWFQEGQAIYPAMYRPKYDGGLLQGNSAFVAIASSSPSAQPVTVWWDDNGFDFAGTHTSSHVAGIQHPTSDLRLSIYFASWGTSDVTDFVRRHYITDSLVNPPTVASGNTWSMTASNLNMGPDPNPNVGKSLVVIYRLAYVIGRTAGIVNDPNFSPTFVNGSSTADQVPAVATDQYPILKEISVFFTASAQENNPVSINLLSKSLDAPTFPSGSTPFLASCVWSVTDITPQAQSYFNAHWAPGTGNIDLPIDVHSLAVNGVDLPDPWPAVQKTVTALVGYPISGAGTGNGNLSWRNILQIMPVNPPGSFAIPQSIPAPNTIAPPAFTAYPQAGFERAIFINQTPFTCWPLIVGDGGSIIWDGKAQGDGTAWRLTYGKPQNLLPNTHLPYLKRCRYKRLLEF